MSEAVSLAVGALLVAGAFMYARRTSQAGQGADLGALQALAEAGQGVAQSVAQETFEAVDSWTGGRLRLSAMSQVQPEMVNHPNVRAFLAVIRRGEGTSGANGYRTLFGGGLFDGYTDHPRVVVTRGSYTSSAAGAYQFLASTWDETRRLMNLPDFSPASQDLGALGRIAARGALADVIAGRLGDAIAKCAREWASLPGSPYGQPTISTQTAAATYTGAGGTIA